MQYRSVVIATIIFTLLCLPLLKARAQGCGNLNIMLHSEIASSCPEMTMTMVPDNEGRPYLYVANKEAGLKIYDITDLNSPQLLTSIPISSLMGLHVMNLSQDGNYLYLALGNHFSNSQSPGMAIVDISKPAEASVIGTYVYPSATAGCGIVKAEGNYAYLGAMLHGMVILYISDKQHPTYVSEILPDRNYPTPNPDTLKYNARGMQVIGDLVYLCYDAGGLRIIDTKDKAHPQEIGRYSNPALNGRPRAYNNIVVDGGLAYIAVDYCGMEVLDISDPANITLHGWWNPWNCDDAAKNNWFNSTGHANEIAYNKDCHLVFLSTGKSDLNVVNVADPAHPDSCSNFGGTDNNLGTWGISITQDKIFLSYICAVIPFASNWTGVKLLSYESCLASVSREFAEEASNIPPFPNPSRSEVCITLTESYDVNAPFSVIAITELGATIPMPYHIQGNGMLRVSLIGSQAQRYLLCIRQGTQELRKAVIYEGY